ncbi:MAG: DUF885 family protein, partial [Flavobacterium sp.]|nr:DUF885 family protein [Flavobacterium sp.]
MKKAVFISATIVFSLLLMNWNKEEKMVDFKVLTDNYFKDKCALNPLEATMYGQNEYNDQLVFEMTDAFREKQGKFFEKYQGELTGVDTTRLTPEEKISYQIIKWETEVGKELLQQEANLMPVNQFESTHLKMMQLASGTSAQPFKTEKDYRNFLKRMELYAVWLDSAMLYMEK